MIYVYTRRDNMCMYRRDMMTCVSSRWCVCILVEMYDMMMCISTRFNMMRSHLVEISKGRRYLCSTNILYHESRKFARML